MSGDDWSRYKDLGYYVEGGIFFVFINVVWYDCFSVGYGWIVVVYGWLSYCFFVYVGKSVFEWCGDFDLFVGVSFKIF